MSTAIDTAELIKFFFKRHGHDKSLYYCKNENKSLEDEEKLNRTSAFREEGVQILWITYVHVSTKTLNKSISNIWKKLVVFYVSFDYRLLVIATLLSLWSGQ